MASSYYLKIQLLIVLCSLLTKLLSFNRGVPRYKSPIGCFSESPINNRDQDFRLILNFLTATVATFPLISNAFSNIKEEFRIKPLKSIQSDDFWYPPYVIGYWNTTLTFTGANFTDDIPFSKLLADGDVPGLTPYSIFLTPDLSKPIANFVLRFAQIDAHPREDHPYNLRKMMSAFSPNTVIESAAYPFQKAPTWFASPANHWTIRYRDPYGNGTVEIETQKRSMNLFTGSIETTQFFKQVEYYLFTIHRFQFNFSLL